MRHPALHLKVLAFLFLVASASLAQGAEELAIGETFTMPSTHLGETRRINVFRPTVYGEPVETPLPVLFLLDGGIDEDFLHVAGLLQVFVSNGSVRPMLLVGIENTERRRDLTPPSDDPEDLAMAEHIGGAEAFRDFLGEELFAEIEQRYDVTRERALMGESLAGLFVVETLVNAPSMFETYIAVDPSVWWNRYALNETIADALQAAPARDRELFVAASHEASGAERFQTFISEASRSASLVSLDYVPMPEESHATLFHPAAMRALRKRFPAGAGPAE